MVIETKVDYKNIWVKWLDRTVIKKVIMSLNVCNL